MDKRFHETDKDFHSILKGHLMANKELLYNNI